LGAFLDRKEEPICNVYPSKTEHFTKPLPLIPRSALMKQAAALRGNLGHGDYGSGIDRASASIAPSASAAI
jgi:hypothetical protein